jgi:N utilization substance protein B
LESVDPVERAILRLGAYELIEHPEIPYRVVINEAVELAKTFGAEKGHRYVNGVLDKAARDLRPIEASARR